MADLANEDEKDVQGQPEQAPAESEADSYYGDEELEDGELDLSFLDEEDEDEARDSKSAENK